MGQPRIRRLETGRRNMNPRSLAQTLAHQITRQIGIRWGESFPFYYVSEYPKSGGTWLARMLGDYFELPFPPDNALLPLGFSCIIKNHWKYDPRLRRVFYLYRDGRDVMVSFYFHFIWAARHTQRPEKMRVKRVYEKLFGKDYDPGEIARHLPRFIEHEFAHPGRGTRLNWRDHIEGWYRRERSGVAYYLSYEELRRDCSDTLSRAIESLTGEAVDPWRLETTIEKMSMKRQTGRDPGEADATQFIRKGVVGDWRNYFSREAAEIFNALAGDTLVRLGYETDKGWVDRYEYPMS